MQGKVFTKTFQWLSFATSWRNFTHLSCSAILTLYLCPSPRRPRECACRPGGKIGVASPDAAETFAEVTYYSTDNQSMTSGFSSARIKVWRRLYGRFGLTKLIVLHTGPDKRGSLVVARLGSSWYAPASHPQQGVECTYTVLRTSSKMSSQNPSQKILLGLLELYYSLPSLPRILGPDFLLVVFAVLKGGDLIGEYNPRLLGRDPYMRIRRKQVWMIQSPDTYHAGVLSDIGCLVKIIAPYSNEAFWTACNALASATLTRHSGPFWFTLEHFQPICLDAGVEGERRPCLLLTPSTMAAMHNHWLGLQSVPDLATVTSSF